MDNQTDLSDVVVGYPAVIAFVCALATALRTVQQVSDPDVPVDPFLLVDRELQLFLDPGRPVDGLDERQIADLQHLRDLFVRSGPIGDLVALDPDDAPEH